MNASEHKFDIESFKKHANDTGSTAVQVAILTHRIRYLTTHMQSNKKDIHTRHGLLKIIRLREKLLKYYKKVSATAYYDLIGTLGIRDKK